MHACRGCRTERDSKERRVVAPTRGVALNEIDTILGHTDSVDVLFCAYRLEILLEDSEATRREDGMEALKHGNEKLEPRLHSKVHDG